MVCSQCKAPFHLPAGKLSDNTKAHRRICPVCSAGKPHHTQRIVQVFDATAARPPPHWYDSDTTAMKTETKPKPPPLETARTRFLHSISGRLVAGVVGALVVSGGLLVAMALWLGQQSVKAEQEQAAARLVQVFEASLHTSMLQRDLPSLQRTLQVLGQAPGITQARLLNVQGRCPLCIPSSCFGWAHSSGVPATGLRGCHIAKPLGRYTARNGFTASALPHSQPSQCAQCHGEPDVHPVNGVLLIDFGLSQPGWAGRGRRCCWGSGWPHCCCLVRSWPGPCVAL
jgi:uncharacterized Zn-binding protein involved in type VI secretion